MAHVVCGTERKAARKVARTESTADRKHVLGLARKVAKQAPHGKKTAARKRLERTARAGARARRVERRDRADKPCTDARTELAREVADKKRRRASASPKRKAASRRAALSLWERADLQSADVEARLAHDPVTADVAGLAAAEFRRQPHRWLAAEKKGHGHAWELFANHVREHIGEYRRKSVRKAERRTEAALDREARERLAAELASDELLEAAEREAIAEPDAFDVDSIDFGEVA